MSPIVLSRALCCMVFSVTFNLECTKTGAAATFVGPPVLNSVNGQLSVLMVAAEHTQPSLSGFSGVKFWTYEVCQMPAVAVTACPAGTGQSGLGGVRLALKQGDTLRVRLVDHLPPVTAAQVHHVLDYAPLAFNPTNLHTHGLIVDPHNAQNSKTDPYGDYVLLELPPPNIPYPTAGAHGTVITSNGYVDYLYNIELTHPSGLYWYHPHLHGISLNQVSAGLAGPISIGTPVDYCDDAACVNAVEAATIRYLTLKDTQILSNGQLQTQEDPTFCGPPVINPAAGLPQGSCPGVAPNSGSWIHTVSGQIYPAITVGPGGDVWEIVNASGNRSYELAVGDPVAKSAIAPIPKQVLTIDGVTINAKSAATQPEIAALVANQLSVVRCPGATSVTINQAICATKIRMMPSSRVAVRVVRPDTLATPLNLKLYTALYGTGNLGVAGDQWPAIGLASLTFSPKDPAQPLAVTTKNVTVATISATGQLTAAPVVRTAGSTTLTSASSASASGALSDAGLTAPGTTPVVNPCPALAPGSHRRIKFGYPTPTTFGLGYEEVDSSGVATNTQQIVQFDPAKPTVCVPVPLNGSTYEIWELQNYTPEDHNFHIHQTRFFLVSGGVAPGTTIPALLNGDLVLHDNIPLPRAAGPTGCDGVVSSDGVKPNNPPTLCTPTSTFVVIPFREIGDFVFHCHILEHEDGGMMARIRVQAGL